ncbi:hypothetical protein MN2019_24295 [Mycolicibacterium neoaurum]|uniref:antitoxin VbhA family protein n=1 Tax=Mycolicibacterium neoaurum TaxID=1795 RepID=UPI001BCDD8AA|nr:antitoxin VbhA family protein [Mycolicibacterium neoaurum]QVI27290.1 hypothetical protein MN2019_24295 [Mycolicibacterium neoaurum]
MVSSKNATRQTVVSSVRHSTELEGSRPTAATRIDQLVYIQGLIAASELVDRVRRRYGVK